MVTTIIIIIIIINIIIIIYAHLSIFYENAQYNIKCYYWYYNEIECIKLYKKKFLGS